MSANTTKLVPMLTKFLKHVKNGPGFDTSAMSKAKIVSLGDGQCKAEFTVTPELGNFVQQLHGGYTATIMDAVAVIALTSNRNEGGVTVNYNISYIKSAAIGEEVTVEAKTVKLGKTVSFVEAKARNKKTGELLAFSSQSLFFILPDLY